MELLKNIQVYYESFIDLIFPPYCTCIICKGVLKTGSYGICLDCLDEVQFIGKGRWLQTGNIRYEDDSYRMFSVVEYRGEIRRLLYRLKYNNETYLSRDMGKMMGEVIKREGIVGDIIIPVPLFKRKERERGFNQANLLAKYISKYEGTPYSSDNLIRSKNTKMMHRLSKRDRRSNVADAFRVVRPQELFQQRVILVDDILTTGATVEACIRLLLEAGADFVTVVTFAKKSIND